MLALWIYDGECNDPYDEFLVAENRDKIKEGLADDYNDSYWEKRYTLRDGQVAAFLNEADLTERILATGKYLNVIRETGREIDNEARRPIPYAAAAGASSYVTIVNQAHNFASSRLLGVLLGEFRLVERLRSLKHYFLLDRGDFFATFLAVAGDELDKQVTECSPSRLMALLEESLRASVLAADPYCTLRSSVHARHRPLTDTRRNGSLCAFAPGTRACRVRVRAICGPTETAD